MTEEALPVADPAGDSRDPGSDPLPETAARYEKMSHRLQWKIRVHDLPTYPVRVNDGVIEVEL